MLLVGGTAWASDFCKGYQAGYKRGWCSGQSYGCIPPIPPICPIPNIGESTYQDGYDRGFGDGKEARDRQR